MPQGESHLIRSKAMYRMAKKSMYAAAIFNRTIQLHEAPSDPDRIYTVDDKKYGQPKFRIKRRSGGDMAPDSDAFWFTKDETTQQIILHCVIEVYRNEADVAPLPIREPA